MTSVTYGIELFRPFRTDDVCGRQTQGVALGFIISPRSGLAFGGLKKL